MIVRIGYALMLAVTFSVPGAFVDGTYNQAEAWQKCGRHEINCVCKVAGGVTYINRKVLKNGRHVILCLAANKQRNSGGGSSFSGNASSGNSGGGSHGGDGRSAPSQGTR